MIDTSRRVVHPDLGQALTWVPPVPESMHDLLGQLGVVEATCRDCGARLTLPSDISTFADATLMVLRQGWGIDVREIVNPGGYEDGEYVEPWTQIARRLTCYGCRAERAS